MNFYYFFGTNLTNKRASYALALRDSIETLQIILLSQSYRVELTDARLYGLLAAKSDM